MKFFSYSPADGFSFHGTKEEAVKETSSALDIKKDGAGDGWSEDVCEICWGVICERATKTNERPAEPGSDFDYLCEYELEPDPELREILLAAGSQLDTATARANDLEEKHPDSSCSNGHPEVRYWSCGDDGKELTCPVCSAIARAEALTKELAERKYQDSDYERRWEEVKKAKNDRDTAIARAEKAEQEAARLEDILRGSSRSEYADRCAEIVLLQQNLDGANAVMRQERARVDEVEKARDMFKEDAQLKTGLMLKYREERDAIKARVTELERRIKSQEDEIRRKTMIKANDALLGEKVEDADLREQSGDSGDPPTTDALLGEKVGENMKQDPDGTYSEAVPL